MDLPPASVTPLDSGASRSLDATLEDDLALAHRLADVADAISTDRFRALDLRVSTKPDLTPVSDADVAVEAALRGVLAADRPGDAVLGEESGLTGAAHRCWVIDPIDGTKNFVRGVPVWATLIARMDGGDVCVAVVSAPALGRRWWAVRGGGAWAGGDPSTGERLHVSGVSSLADASFSYSSLTGWEEQGRLEGFLALTRAVWRTRGYGDFWSHVLVAEGVVDAAAEPEVSLWDLAAPSLVVSEAGGRFTGLDGRSGPGRGSAVSTNGALHDDVLGLIGARRR